MTKLNLGCGPYHLDGFDNLDANTGWRFEDGLSQYGNGTIAAVTIGHALMYVPIAEWPEVFAEIHRVLKPEGIVRITEDSTGDPNSERYGGWHDAVTLTTPELVRKHLKAAGFGVRKHSATSTGFADRSLLQDLHGGEPKCFFIEGTRLG